MGWDLVDYDRHGIRGLIGGDYSGMGGVSGNKDLCSWDGANVSLIGGGLNGSIGALAVNGSALYVTGGSTVAGTVPCSNTAMWNGSAWNPLGCCTSPGGCNGMTAVPGGMFAFGGFTTAGSVTKRYEPICPLRIRSSGFTLSGMM